MASEIELKLSLNESHHVDAAIQGLKKVFPGLELEKIRLSNVYFDTPGLDLNREKIALRIRSKNGSFVQTIKTKGKSVDGISHRGEWEWQLPGPELDRDVLAKLDAWPGDIDTSALTRQFETNFTRYKSELEYQGARFELALDIGEVIAGDKRLPIAEIEVELLRGDAASLNGVADLIGQCLAVTPCDISKAERGYSLSQND